MDLQQLSYFMSVMEHKNFTKAAEAVFSSQSNISKQISKLENELNTALFHRKNVGVCPTVAAERLYKGLVELRPMFERLIKDTKEIDRKTIRIGFCDSIDFNTAIPSVFDDIREFEPSLNVVIEAYNVERLLESVSKSAIDVGIIFSVIDVNIPNIERYPIRRANNLIYFSKRHYLYKRKNLTLADFKDETFFQLDINIRKSDTNPYSCLPFSPKIVQVNSLSAILLNIESCAGVAMLGQSQSFLGKESIATLEVESKGQMVGTDAIWLNNNTNPSLPVFFHYFYKHCANYQS